MDEVLLQLARDSITEKFDGNLHINRGVLAKENSEMQKEGATFVTLTIDGDLRGCIGSLVAHRALIDDVYENAKAAAFRDPRFIPLSEKELDLIKIEISILSAPEPLEYSDINDLKEKIRIGIDGVILSKSGRSATFLPSVWEQLPDFDIFFVHLCQKAGMQRDCLLEHPEIYTYQARKIEEK